MKKSRLTESQIFTILRAVENGRLVKDVCREYGITPQGTGFRKQDSVTPKPLSTSLLSCLCDFTTSPI